MHQDISHFLHGIANCRYTPQSAWRSNCRLHHDCVESLTLDEIKGVRMRVGHSVLPENKVPSQWSDMRGSGLLHVKCKEAQSEGWESGRYGSRCLASGYMVMLHQPEWCTRKQGGCLGKLVICYRQCTARKLNADKTSDKHSACPCHLSHHLRAVHSHISGFWHRVTPTSNFWDVTNSKWHHLCSFSSSVIRTVSVPNL